MTFEGSEEKLDEFMSRPGKALVESLARSQGDFIVLGAAGKMGPSLSLLLKRGLEQAGLKRRLWAVSRFSEPGSAGFFARHGIETLSCDLLDPEAVARLPFAANVIFLAGRKFGTSGSEPQTWASNALAPAYAARHFKGARIVALSTGCVYPMAPVEGPGCAEGVAPNPPGEYAQSCLARERVFDYHSRSFATPACLIRLNYAIDLRYGVLFDLAKKVFEGRPVDLSTPCVNFIWQGEANDRILRALELCESPAKPLNVTGMEKLAVKDLATRLGEIMGKPVSFEGKPAPTAWLNDASQCSRLFGAPEVAVEQMLGWVADWVRAGGRELGKPTHFESRDAKF